MTEAIRTLSEFSENSATSGRSVTQRLINPSNNRMNKSGRVKDMKRNGPPNTGSALPRILQPPVATAALVLQVQRAMSLHQQGNLTEAGDIYSAVLRTAPNQVESLHYLGVVKYQMGRHEAAIELIQKAIKLNRADPSSHSNLGLALHSLRRYQAALESFERALALNPNFTDALSNRGNVLRELQRFDEALNSYDAALMQRPNAIEIITQRGVTLKCMGRVAEALMCYDRAIALQPSAKLWNARGCLLASQFRFDEALESFWQAIKIEPNYKDAWNNRGGTYYLIGQQQAAVEAFEQGVLIDPDSADFRFKRLIARIPVILEEEDDVTAIRDNFASDIAAYSLWLKAHMPQDPLAVVGSCQPFYLAYHNQNNRDLLALYGQVCARLMAAWAAHHGIALPPARVVAGSRIRLGIVSAHLTDHPVWTAIVRGWFQELDPAHFELHVFHLGTHEDAQTALARTRASAFHSGAYSTLEWAKRIIACELDVLIYPELGMDALTSQLAAMRLVQRQAASWGHPETTGLPTIDRYLSAEAFETCESQDCYTERLVCLPHLGCYYEPDPVPVIDVNLRELGVRTGATLFVCPGSPYKYVPQHDHVFVDIAKRVPDVQFMFFTLTGPQALSSKLQKRLDTRFHEAGLDPSHYLVVIPWQTRQQFYAIMRQADIFLDTIGFSGFNTAMQAIDCALPIVTIEGQFMRGRFASAILKRIGMEELVQVSDVAYVNAAVRLAGDPVYRNGIKAALKTGRSVLYRDTAPIRALESVLEEWCASAP